MLCFFVVVVLLHSTATSLHCGHHLVSTRSGTHTQCILHIHQLLIVSPRSVRVLIINCTVSELHPASQSDRPRSEQLLKGALTVSLHRTVYVSHTFETYHEHGPKYGVSTTGDKKAEPTFGPRSVYDGGGREDSMTTLKARQTWQRIPFGHYLCVMHMYFSIVAPARFTFNCTSAFSTLKVKTSGMPGTIASSLHEIGRAHV